MDNNDDRQELYNRFVKEIPSGHASAYFDEDDLVEIFDYAGDLNDDFVRLEVLWCGARYFPDSMALAERKAYLYSELGNDAAASLVLSRVPDDSVMKRLLMLRINGGERAEVIGKLDRIVAEAKEFSDEDIFQLVSTATDLGVYDWTKQNCRKIKRKTDFPQSFLYDLVEEAENNHDYDFELELLEELTMLEPFNAEFWTRMAEVFFVRLQNLEKALQAIDYALAADPGSVRAQLMHAQILFDSGADLDLMEKLLKPVLEKNPDEGMAVDTLALVYASNSRLQDGLDLIYTYLSRFPAHRPSVDLLLTVLDGEIPPYVMTNYYESADNFTEDDWIDWARRYIADNNDAAASTILLSLAERHFISANNFSVLAETCYRAGKYRELTECFEKRCEAIAGNDISAKVTFEALLPVALSYLRIDEIEKLRNLLPHFLIDFQPASSIGMSAMIALKDVQERLGNIYAVISAGRKPDADLYDPYK